MLYSGLSAEEAAAIVENIRDEGVAYELKAGGTAVYVPEQKVYPMRLLLAGQGLPTGDQAGYRILDDEKIGASPFIQRVNYNRAIEGELSKTIQTLQGVASARVHVVRPEATLFAGQDGEEQLQEVISVWTHCRIPSPQEIRKYYEKYYGIVKPVLCVRNRVPNESGNSLPR